jgi:hemerythrin superfamily protein
MVHDARGTRGGNIDCFDGDGNFLGDTTMPARKKTPARKQSRPASRAPADAIALLKADHALVEDLFEKYEKARGDDRKAALAGQICNELKVHTRIEEEIFYPAAREVLREEDLIDEATVEHQGAKDLIAQIESGKPGDDLYDAKVKVLSEYIKHHVKEEHQEMFPQVRKTRLDLKELGERMQARKTELKAGGGGRSSSSGGLQGSGSRRGANRAQKAESEGLMTTLSRELGLRKS